jgi:hypothetical protein
MLLYLITKQTIDTIRSSAYVPSSDDLSFVQKKEDETNKAMMMMMANAQILESLTSFYSDLIENSNFPLAKNLACQAAVAELTIELRDLVHEFERDVVRARTLGKITADRKMLVCSG